MFIDHLPDIHPIDVIGSEDGDKGGMVAIDEIEVLVDGIRGSLIPLFSDPHLGRDYGDKMVVGKAGDPPAYFEMLDQRLGLELGQDIDGLDAGVDEVGQDKVDDSIFASVSG
jgi:hypothetical protein